MAKSEASLTVRTKLLLLVALMNGLLLLAGSFVIARLYLVASSYENFREHTVHFSNINAVVDDLATLRNSLGVGLRAGGGVSGGISRAWRGRFDFLGFASGKHRSPLPQLMTVAEQAPSQLIQGEACGQAPSKLSANRRTG